MSFGRLRLTGSELAGSSGTGEQAFAEMFVYATEEGNIEVSAFKLVVMSYGQYRMWFRQAAAGGLLPGETWPLVIPPEELADQSLARYLEQTFLDPNDPERVNDIWRNLERLPQGEPPLPDSPN